MLSKTKKKINLRDLGRVSNPMLSKKEFSGLYDFLSLLVSSPFRNDFGLVLPSNHLAKPLADLLLEMGIFESLKIVTLGKLTNVLYYFPTLPYFDDVDDAFSPQAYIYMIKSFKMNRGNFLSQRDLFSLPLGTFYLLKWFDVWYFWNPILVKMINPLELKGFRHVATLSYSNNLVLGRRYEKN